MRKSKHAAYARLRREICLEAARLMYEEQINQYYDAKNLAAKKLLGRGGGAKLKAAYLPSNGEIADALFNLSRFYEGNELERRLFEMRLTALDLFPLLMPFSPRLIGSVSTGRIRRTSDIDFHLFSDSVEAVANHLRHAGVSFEVRDIDILKASKVHTYSHIYFDAGFPVECSIYPEAEIRIRTRSSTDGKPIVRLKQTQLLELISTDHPELWQRHIGSQV